MITVLREVISDPGMPDDRLLQIIAGPISLTGSELTGDFDALFRGERTTIREAARVTRTGVTVRSAPEVPPRQLAGTSTLGNGSGQPGRRAHLVVDAVPRELAGPELEVEIRERIRLEGWQPPEPPPGSKYPEETRRRMAARALPIADVLTASEHNDIQVAIILRPGADPQAVQAELAGLAALGTDMPAQFPAPLPDLLRTWVTARRREDITASLNQFEAAIQADRLDQRAC